jgi:hypothetical protein
MRKIQTQHVESFGKLALKRIEDTDIAYLEVEAHSKPIVSNFVHTFGPSLE